MLQRFRGLDLRQAGIFCLPLSVALRFPFVCVFRFFIDFLVDVENRWRIDVSSGVEIESLVLTPSCKAHQWTRVTSFGQS